MLRNLASSYRRCDVSILARVSGGLRKRLPPGQGRHSPAFAFTHTVSVPNRHGSVPALDQRSITDRKLRFLGSKGLSSSQLGDADNDDDTAAIHGVGNALTKEQSRRGDHACDCCAGKDRTGNGKIQAL